MAGRAARPVQSVARSTSVQKGPNIANAVVPMEHPNLPHQSHEPVPVGTTNPGNPNPPGQAKPKASRKSKAKSE